MEKTKSLTDVTPMTTCRFQSTSKQIENQCNQVQMEIEKFIKSYKQAIEDHRKELYKQVRHIKEERLQALEEQKNDLLKKSKEAREIVNFVSELLNNGTDVEILNFVKPLLKKMEICNKIDDILESNVLDSVLFLPEEVAQTYDNCCPIYGVLTTQTVQPKNCTVNAKGK